ncbi:MAG: FAD:protein FMN transferase, partial [Chloroflexi bacterium]
MEPSRGRALRRGGHLDRGPASVTIERRVFQALGGECELYAVGLPAPRLADGEAWVHEMHDRLTRFTPTSELSRFNTGAGRWVEISPLLESLLRESLR